MVDPSFFDLGGKKVLVTGGATGVGWACAAALAASGADVAIVGRREEAGRAAVAALRELGREAMFVRCDISRAEPVEATIATIVQRFGRLDIAVNDARALALAPVAPVASVRAAAK